MLFMNQGFVKKIMKALLKLFMKSKKNNMGTDNKTPQGTDTPQGITANTPIIFNVKSFFGLIGTLLGILFGFYTLVIVPNLKKSEQHQKDLYEQQKEFIIDEFSHVKGEISKNTKAINLNTNGVNATNERFRDLNKSIEESNNSGGFGNTDNIGLVTFPLDAVSTEESTFASN